MQEQILKSSWCYSIFLIHFSTRKKGPLLCLRIPDLQSKQVILRPVHTRHPTIPRSLPLWKNGRIGNEQAFIGESVCWSKIQRGLVGPALRGRGMNGPLIRSTPTYLRCIADQADQNMTNLRCTADHHAVPPLNIRPVERGITPDHFSTGWKTYPAHHDLSERARPTTAVFQTNIRSPRSRPARCRSVYFSRAGVDRLWTGL